MWKGHMGNNTWLLNAHVVCSTGSAASVSAAAVELTPFTDDSDCPRWLLLPQSLSSGVAQRYMRFW